MGEKERLITQLPPLSQDIIQFAREHGRVTVRSVQRITGANRNTIKAHIKKLLRSGKIKKIGAGKGTWYRLP